MSAIISNITSNNVQHSTNCAKKKYPEKVMQSDPMQWDGFVQDYLTFYGYDRLNIIQQEGAWKGKLIHQKHSQ